MGRLVLIDHAEDAASRDIVAPSAGQADDLCIRRAGLEPPRIDREVDELVFLEHDRSAGMDQLAIAVGEAPHRRKVRVADRLVPGKSGQEIFRQIERIVAPGSPRRLAVHPAHLPPADAQGGTGLGNQDGGVDRIVEPIERKLHGHFRQHARRGEPRVVGRREQEPQEVLHVDRMPGAAESELQIVIGLETIACGVAKRAINGDAFVAELLDRHSDRQRPTFLPGKPERAVAAIARFLGPVALARVFLHQVREHPGQNHEDRVGNADDFATERAVVESFGVVLQVLFSRLEEFPPDDAAAQHAEHGHDGDADDDPTFPNPLRPRHRPPPQNVFRNSTRASLSSADSSVPYSRPSWPRLLLPAQGPGTQMLSS